jgi:hypothetical protein
VPDFVSEQVVDWQRGTLEQTGFQVGGHAGFTCQHRFKPQCGSISGDRFGEVVALLVGNADGFFNGTTAGLLVAEAWCGTGVVRYLVVLEAGASSGSEPVAGSLSALVSRVSSRTGPKSRVCAGITPISRILAGVASEPWLRGSFPWWW